ncbi:ABC transporter ATP-binding protein [Chitinophaga flava]|uniref:Multidrug ABC transporter ATP-binding protein n=1 Tax=Chitinophaga flava TaxID=2259036 RepID=A0A365XXS6_9BACT|nr:ABC transporter transmembrane domain-containing protein [Chitinophaga flava]RBL90514.1 multidrug ABC transporter ATP-binding protein [Chitinophaga flava]
MRIPIVHANNMSSPSALAQTLRLFRYLKPHWPALSAGIFSLLLMSLAGLAFPKMLGMLIDVSAKPHTSADIHRIGLSLLGVLIAQSIFSFIRTVLFANVSEKTLAALRQSVYNHLIQLPMQFYQNRRVGELSSRLSSDTALLQETLTNTVSEFIRQVIVVIGGFVLLIMTSPGLTAFVLAILPVITAIAFFFGRFIRQYSKGMQDQIAASNTIVEETLQGIFSVKIFTGEFREMARYREHTNKAARLGIQGGKYRAAFSSFVILGIFGALVAIIWRGSVIGLDTGELFSFVLYAVFIGTSITGMAELYASLQKSLGVTENLFSILDEPIEAVTDINGIEKAHHLHGNISFKNVSFHYPSREEVPVLRNMSFEVKANQTVAVVGPSGAGKSTLVSLLMRLYDPAKGQVIFDNSDGPIIPLSALRSQIAVVPQDVFLFGGTIAENIAYGKQGTTKEELIDAAKKANAWEFIQRFPDGLQTIVGERGIQLSGGQRQRIAIARAVLKAPKILILDEATSALDAESERLVQDALNNLMEGRTSIVIAHRLATIRQASNIVVIDRGAVVEAGTHTELINKHGGLYKQLSEMQFMQ